MKIVPVKNSQNVYFKQNVYYKKLSQYIFRPASGYLLEINFRVTFSLEIPEIDLQFFSKYSGRLLQEQARPCQAFWAIDGHLYSDC